MCTAGVSPRNGSMHTAARNSMDLQKRIRTHRSSFPFCTWRSLRWGMGGLDPSDPFGQRRLNCPEL
eukprot:306023-Chlamydomonas_euryale.AAC.1